MTTDLAVIGGGVIGATIASLAKKAHPHLTIAILERHLVGTGASLYGGAVRVPIGTTSAHRELARRSERLFSELAAWAGPLPGRAVPVFWVVPAGREAEFADYWVGGACRRATSGEQARLGRTMPALSLAPDDLLLVDETAWCGNPGATASHLIGHLLRQPGFACHEGVHVVAIEDQAGGCDLVAADGQVFRSRHVVRATGPWLDLHDRRVPDSGLRTKKVAALHVDLVPAADDPIIVFVEEDAYLLPDPAGRRWILCISSPAWDLAPARSGLACDAEDRAVAARVLNRHAPGLLDRCRGERVFCDAYTATRLPAIGRDPQSARSVYALGGSGSGYRFAPAIAERAIGLLLGSLSTMAVS